MILMKNKILKYLKEGIQFIEYTSTPHRRVTTKNLQSKKSQSFENCQAY